mgnify:CR=1 FL=1
MLRIGIGNGAASDFEQPPFVRLGKELAVGEERAVEPEAGFNGLDGLSVVNEDLLKGAEIDV